MLKPFPRFILSLAAMGLAGCLYSEYSEPTEPPVDSTPGEPVPEASLPLDSSPDNPVTEASLPELPARNDEVSSPDDTEDSLAIASLIGSWCAYEFVVGGARHRTVHLSDDGTLEYSGSHPGSGGLCRMPTVTRSMTGTWMVSEDTIYFHGTTHGVRSYRTSGGGKNCGVSDISFPLDPISSAFSFALLNDTLWLEADSSWPGYHYMDPEEVPMPRSFTRCSTQ